MRTVRIVSTKQPLTLPACSTQLNDDDDEYDHNDDDDGDDDLDEDPKCGKNMMMMITMT